MQLTRYTDNALRILMYLALKPNELGTVANISDKLAMSRNHLVKVVHRLSILGYISSTQGRGGGVKLAKPANEITVGMIVRDMETTLEIIDCDTKPCPIVGACKLKGVVTQATQQFLTHLDQYTIAELVSPPTELLSLIE